MKYQVDTEQLRKLIEGKYRFYPCLECNATGSVLVDGDVGIVVTTIHPEKGASSYYQDCCDYCEGLGGKLVFE